MVATKAIMQTVSQASSAPSAVAMYGEFEGRPTIRCPHCFRVQFTKETRVNCIVCHVQLLRIMDLQPYQLEFQAVALDLGSDCGRKICRRLRDLRRAKGIPQSTLADVSGHPRSYISKIENGNLVPRLESVARLADGLGVSLAQLFDETVTARSLARSTMHKGGADADLMSSLASTLSVLGYGMRMILIDTARDLSRGRPAFAEWAAA